MRSPTRSPSTAAPSRLPSILVLVAGLWLVVGWAVLGYGDVRRAVAVDIIVGTALILLGSFRLLARWTGRALAATIVVAGLCLVIAPVVLGYGYVERPEDAYANDIVVGLLVIGAGVWASKQ